MKEVPLTASVLSMLLSYPLTEPGGRAGRTSRAQTADERVAYLVVPFGHAATQNPAQRDATDLLLRELGKRGHRADVTRSLVEIALDGSAADLHAEVVEHGILVGRFSLEGGRWTETPSTEPFAELDSARAQSSTRVRLTLSLVDSRGHIKWSDQARGDERGTEAVGQTPFARAFSDAVNKVLDARLGDRGLRGDRDPAYGARTVLDTCLT